MYFVKNSVLSIGMTTRCFRFDRVLVDFSGLEKPRTLGFRLLVSPDKSLHCACQNLYEILKEEFLSKLVSGERLATDTMH